MNKDDMELFGIVKSSNQTEAIVIVPAKDVKRKVGPERKSDDMYEYLKLSGLTKPMCWVAYEIPAMPERFLLYGNSKVDLDTIGKFNTRKFIERKMKEYLEIEKKVFNKLPDDSRGIEFKWANCIWYLAGIPGEREWIKFCHTTIDGKPAPTGIYVEDAMSALKNLKCYSCGDYIDTFKGMYQGDKDHAVTLDFNVDMTGDLNKIHERLKQLLGSPTKPVIKNR